MLFASFISVMYFDGSDALLARSFSRRFVSLRLKRVILRDSLPLM